MNKIITFILKAFFRLLYHEFAWTYDWVAWIVSLGRWNDWVLSVLPYVQGTRILEMGHGPGHLQIALFENGLVPTGLDASRQMSKMASQRLKRSGYLPLLVNGYAQFTPFPNSSFDTILATFPTESIFQPETLAEIRRILKPDGVLLILPVATIQPTHLADRFFAWLFRVTRQSPIRIDAAYREQISQPFLKSGFNIETRILNVRNSHVLLLIGTKTRR